MLVAAHLVAISEDVSDVLSLGAELALDAAVSGTLAGLVGELGVSAEELAARFEIGALRFKALGIEAERRRRLMYREAVATGQPEAVVVRHAIQAVEDGSDACGQLAPLASGRSMRAALEIVHADLMVCRARIAALA